MDTGKRFFVRRIYLAAIVALFFQISNFKSEIANAQTTQPADLKKTLAAANAGSAEAQCEMGIICATGRGVVGDMPTAIKWFAKSAAQGYAPAERHLGVAYESGLGITRDSALAIKWYTKAAEQGDAIAEVDLGTMYLVGNNVPKDAAAGLKWIQKAADQGDAGGEFVLGRVYLFGDGVTKDIAMGLKWTQMAADKGDADAQCFLGTIYAYSKLVPRDDALALKWFKKSADQGDGEGEYNLGMMYLLGQGMGAIDERTAILWFQKAALHNSDGQDALADIIQSKKWQGQTDLAHKIFQPVYDAMMARFQQNPGDLQAANGIAWFCAKCDENLDKALELATAASKSIPENWAFIDTLAEVNFHLGRFDDAINIETKAMSLKPGDATLAKQMSRFQDGKKAATTKPAVGKH